MQRKKASSDKAPSKQTQPRPRRNFVGDPALALGIGVRIVKGLEENGGRKSHATRLLKNDQKLKEVLEVLMRDDKLNPGEAATRTQELIEKDKVHFVVGSLSAAVQLSINAVTKARGVIFVSISQSDAINEAKDWSKYTFHEALNPHMTAGAVGRYAFGKFGKRVVFLTADYAYGHEMVRGFLTRLVEEETEHDEATEALLKLARESRGRMGDWRPSREETYSGEPRFDRWR